MAKIKFSNPIQNYHHYTYNDGIAYFGLIKILKNAKKEKIGETIEIIGKRPFANVNIRDSDNDIAESLGYTIDKKIRVPLSQIPENVKFKLNNDSQLYEVKKRDSSDGRNLYLYLQIASNKKMEA